MRQRVSAQQLLRRTLQLLVIGFIVYAAFGGAWRNYKVAHNHRRIVSMIEGPTWGGLYGMNEDLLSLQGEPYRASLDYLGMPWSARLFGIDIADPVLALNHLVLNGSMPLSLLFAALIPIGLAVVLGKVFCSHLCPMRLLFELGQRVRAGLVRMGLALPRLESNARFGGWVLLGGLLAALLSSSAVWLFILPYVSVGAGLFLWISSSLEVSLLLVVAAWLAVDTLLAPGWFCHNLCPTGFVLEKLSSFKLWRVAKDSSSPCPKACDLCQVACPYPLSPKMETHAAGCDQCGLCVSVCPTEKLSRVLVSPATIAPKWSGAGRVIPLVSVLLGGFAIGLALVPEQAMANHNKGIPHYGYLESYPQVPVEEFFIAQGDWEVSATLYNFQGLDRRAADTPNDVKIYLAIFDHKAHSAYVGPLSVDIMQGGELVSSYERVSVDEESVYSTRETLPRSGDYELILRFGEDDEQKPISIALPFNVKLANESPSIWRVAMTTGPLLALVGVAIYGSRRRGRKGRS